MAHAPVVQKWGDGQHAAGIGRHGLKVSIRVAVREQHQPVDPQASRDLPAHPRQFLKCILPMGYGAGLVGKPAGQRLDIFQLIAFPAGVAGEGDRQARAAPNSTPRPRASAAGSKEPIGNVVSMKESLEEKLEASMAVLRDGLKLT